MAIEDVRLAIDPFLADHEQRLFPPPSLDALGDRLDWLLITHEHLDHLDTPSLPAIVGRYPHLRIALPAPIVSEVAAVVDDSRLVGVEPGETLTLSPRVDALVIPAFHAVDAADEYASGAAGGLGPRFVGYVIRGERLSLYHPGDTIVTPDLLAALEGVRIDVALLPINGRDYFREEAGLVGNMNVREAVRLADRLDVETLVPMHWDLFRGNTERPGAVLDEVQEVGAALNVLTLARMRPFRVSTARTKADGR